MALEDLNPAVRVEEILDGADIEPATRLEYFMKKAANEVPKPAGSADAGKVVTVNEDGDGFELSDVDPGLPEIAGVSDAGKVVTVNENGDGFELDNVPEELPAYTSADNGKVLTVGSESTVTAYNDTLELSAEGQGLLLNFAVPQNEWIVGKTTGELSWSDGQGGGADVDLTAQEYEGLGVILGNDTYNVAVVYTNGVYGVSMPAAASKQISLVITVTQAPTISWESAGGGAAEIVYIGNRQFGNAADFAMLDEPGGNKLTESQCRAKIESLIGKTVTLRKGTDENPTDYSGYFAEHDAAVLVFIDTSGGSPILKTAGFIENAV